MDFVNSLSFINFSKSSLILSILPDIDSAASIVNLISFKVSSSLILDKMLFKCPAAIVISFNQKFGVGSARSIEGIDLGNIIIQAKEKGILIKGGGHKMAAGFSIKEEKIEEFKDFINKSFLKIKKDMKNNNEIFYDSIISPSALNENFYEEINFTSPVAMEIVLEAYETNKKEPNFSNEWFEKCTEVSCNAFWADLKVAVELISD